MDGRIVLAPMEGVLDYSMRRLLTEINRYDWCVSEFVRVSDVVLSQKVFFKEVPELLEGGTTASGTPVWVQLLGSRPDIVAESAMVAVKLGAPGIDLNFGCPSRLVNKSMGGAAVLRNPLPRFLSVPRSGWDGPMPRRLPRLSEIWIGPGSAVL